MSPEPSSNASVNPRLEEQSQTSTAQKSNGQTPTPQAIDVSECEREPIHIPNAIQPHGVLMVIDPENYRILQISINIVDWFDRPASAILGESVLDFLQPQSPNYLLHRLKSTTAGFTNPLELEIETCSQGSCLCDGILHRQGNLLILELENLRTKPSPARQHDPLLRSESPHWPALEMLQQPGAAAAVPLPTVSGIASIFYELQYSISQIMNSGGFSAACVSLTREVHRLTGFDRVMVYQFNQSGDGEVIAEQRRSDLEPFLGLRYPASDIPAQARRLYTTNWLRLIADVNYQPAPLVPIHTPDTAEPLDMSQCVLRSVSPVHISYLQNMGVTASMSISLVFRGQLWGMVACHHMAAKFVPHPIRAGCEMLAAVFSNYLITLQEAEMAQRLAKRREQLTQLLHHIMSSDHLAASLWDYAESLLSLMGASGVVFWYEHNFQTCGTVPTQDYLERLCEYLQQHAHDALFIEEQLGTRFPELAAGLPQTAGVLALTFSGFVHDALLFFRPEVVQTILWAGKPDKMEQVEQGDRVVLMPRRSFAQWAEQVQGRCQEWDAADQTIAQELQQGLAVFAFRKTQELAQRNLQLQQRNEELDAFAYIVAHDLKEPLRGIARYSRDLLSQPELQARPAWREPLHGVQRLQTRMLELLDAVLHFSGAGQLEILEQIDLQQILQEALEMVQCRVEETGTRLIIPRPLPRIPADPSRLREVLLNLLSNAIKYNNRPAGERWVRVDYCGFEDPEFAHWCRLAPPDLLPSYIFRVSDNGIGIAAQHFQQVFDIFRRLHPRQAFGGGNGLGLTIVKRIIERHRGRVWLESKVDQGTCIYFSLPLSQTDPPTPAILNKPD